MARFISLWYQNKDQQQINANCLCQGTIGEFLKLHREQGRNVLIVYSEELSGKELEDTSEFFNSVTMEEGEL